MKEQEVTDPEDKPSRRRGGCLLFLLRWMVRGFTLLVLAVVLPTVFNMLRPIETPQALRDDPGNKPAALADQASTATRVTAAPATDTTRATSVNGTVPSTAGASAVTTSTTTTTAAMSAPPNPAASDPMITADLIALDSITDPEKKAKAAEINALYHRWVDLLALYEADRTTYEALPAERRQPFDQWPNYFGYTEIAHQLASAGFGAAEQRVWNDRFLRSLAAHRDWEAASERAWKNTEYNTMLDTLYYARHCHGLVGPLRVALYPPMRLVLGLIDRQRGGRPVDQPMP